MCVYVRVCRGECLQRALNVGIESLRDSTFYEKGKLLRAHGERHDAAVGQGRVRSGEGCPALDQHPQARHQLRALAARGQGGVGWGELIHWMMSSQRVY